MIKKNLCKFFGSLKENWVDTTLNCLFIFIFINIFTAVFGPENSMTGVSLVIIMMSSMAQDMTAVPFKHFLSQSAVLLLMALSSCLVGILPPYLVFFLNFITVFIIIYAFTYEYADHMYFPYILSYLFLIFIAPVSLEQLPKRMTGMVAGAACIILYQLFKGRRRIHETAQYVLSSIMDNACQSIRCLTLGEGEKPSPQQVRAQLCKLSHIVFQRRRKVFCISDASFALVDVGRGMEILILLLNSLPAGQNPEQLLLLERIFAELEKYRGFLFTKDGELPPLNRQDFMVPQVDPEEKFYFALDYLRSHLLAMRNPQKKTCYRKTALSFKVRLQAVLDISAIRVVYSLRVSLMLSVFLLVVQALSLTHGKWLMFTLASLSLPYADGVSKKTGQRVTATMIGCLTSLVLYSFIPSAAGRTVVMIFFGYFSGFFSVYTGVYACSTISALGAAVMAAGTGFSSVAFMCLVRLIYILLGSLIALLANCVLLPFNRSRATELLIKKYSRTTELLSHVCQEENIDPQIYYNLVIQAHLQEEKLVRNAADAGWNGMEGLLEACRRHVQEAHRHHPFPCSSVAS